MAAFFANEMAQYPDPVWLPQTRCQTAEKISGDAAMTATTDISLGILQPTG